MGTILVPSNVDDDGKVIGSDEFHRKTAIRESLKLVGKLPPFRDIVLDEESLFPIIVRRNGTDKPVLLCEEVEGETVYLVKYPQTGLA